ncbi:MAG: glycosyltransferase family 2 protein [Bacteroidaceae bacterium]|nr:glycosyltransferase family 2 protein [Bacteroidaceae bacterium]
MNRKKHYTIKPIEVSFITVNYNGFKDTCQMIESIRDHVRAMTYEIIVVDNKSSTNELSMIYRKYPFINAVRSQRNLGFAHGNNLGATVAKGKYLFFINNDTIIKDNTIRRLIDRLESDASIGGVSPMLRYTDEYELVQFAGFTPLTRYTLRNQSIGNGEYIDESYMNPMEIPYLHGAAMMVKREVYEKTCGMPTQYFLYYEELDWSISIRRRGYKLWYEPGCMIYHKESRSTGVQSPLKTYYLTRNRFLFAYRNSKSWDRFITHLYLLFCVAPRDCLYYLLKGKFDLLRAMFAGIINYYSLKKHQKLDSYGFKFSYFLP